MNDSQPAIESNMKSNHLTGQAYSANDPRRKSPFVAGFLSLLPGLGQVYVGYYKLGFIHVLIAGTVLSVLVSAPGSSPFLPLGAMFLAFFSLYNIIDAGRRASMYNLSLDGVTQINLPDDFRSENINGSFLGGGVLIIFAIIALSNTAFGFSLVWLESWWPVAPLCFGVFLIYRAYLDNQAEAAERTP